MSTPLGPGGRQRRRGDGVGRGARRRRAGRRGRADPRAGPGDARRGRAGRTPTRPRRSPTAARWTRGGRWSGRRAATPTRRLPTARETHTVTAEADGFVAAVDAYAIGVAAWRLGAGRARKEDPVSAAAGVLLHRRPGDPVRAGEPLYELRTDDPARFGAALEAAAGAVSVAAEPPAAVPLGHRSARLTFRWAPGRAILAGQGDHRRQRNETPCPCLLPTHGPSGPPVSMSCAGSGCPRRRPASRWCGNPATRSSCGPPARSRRAPRSCTSCWPAVSACRHRRR